MNRLSLSSFSICLVLLLAVSQISSSYYSPVFAQQQNTNPIPTADILLKDATNALKNKDADAAPSHSVNQVSIVAGASTLGDKAYSPNPINVKVGDTVIWTNDDNQPHFVTPAIPEQYKLTMSNMIGPGQTFTNKFDETGTFDYTCSIHPTMHGQVIITAENKTSGG